VEGEDLARLLAHGNPDTLLVGLPLHEALHFVCLNLQTSYEHLTAGGNGLHM